MTVPPGPAVIVVAGGMRSGSGGGRNRDRGRRVRGRRIAGRRARAGVRRAGARLIARSVQRIQSEEHLHAVAQPVAVGRRRRFGAGLRALDLVAVREAVLVRVAAPGRALRALDLVAVREAVLVGVLPARAGARPALLELVAQPVAVAVGLVGVRVGVALLVAVAETVVVGVGRARERRLGKGERDRDGDQGGGDSSESPRGSGLGKTGWHDGENAALRASMPARRDSALTGVCPSRADQPPGVPAGTGRGAAIVPAYRRHGGRL